MNTAVMEHMPPVVVDEGDVTVLRRMASGTWGRYTVTWPEGFEPPELAPDRELGFVAKLPAPQGGRFSRRFVRADAQIDAANGYSNVETILDEAESRTGGDVFFERDITTAGLGRLVPYVHFTIGDVIPVQVWGRVMHLPVTEIVEVSEPGNANGWRVHVGGQLISAPRDLEADNADLRRVIAQERRERQQGDAAVGAVASRAEGKTDTLTTDLTGSVDRSVPAAVEEGTGTLGGMAMRLAEGNLLILQTAFPQNNIIPATTLGRPYWSLGGVHTASDIPPALGERTSEWETTSYQGPYTGSTAGLAYIELSDQVDYKIHFWAKTGGGGSKRFEVRLLDADGVNRITQWRAWSPDQGEWTTGPVAGVNVTSGQWAEHSMVVRLSPGTRRVRLQVLSTSTGDPWINSMRMGVFNLMQEEINSTNAKQLENLDKWRLDYESLLGDVQALQKQTLQNQSYALGTSGPQVSDDYWTASIGGALDTLTLVAKDNPRWTGKVTVSRTVRDGSGIDTSPYVFRTMHSTHSIPQPDGGRTLSFPRQGTNQGINVSALLNYTVEPGMQGTHNRDLGPADTAQGEWDTFIGTTRDMTKAGTNVSIYLSVEWSSATHHDRYGIRILRNGTEITRVLQSNLGPITPLGNGRRSQSTRVTLPSLAAGDRIEFQRFSTAGGAARYFNNARIRMSWIEQP